MIRFEYEITKYPADQFTQLVYFCTDKGECTIDQLPSDQLSIMGELLNERGSQGWELVHIFFGEDGAVVFWKRAIE
jgi:hypothetical protein